MKRKAIVAAAFTFADFWKEYPRKVAKLAGQSAYEKALERSTHAEIMERLNTHKLTQWMGKPEDKIPHPATWLNREDFSDGQVNSHGHVNRESYELPLFAGNESVPEPALGSGRCDLCSAYPVMLREVWFKSGVVRMCSADFALLDQVKALHAK